MKTITKYYINKVSKSTLLGQSTLSLSVKAALTNSIPKATQLKKRLSLEVVSPVIVVVTDLSGKELGRKTFFEKLSEPTSYKSFTDFIVKHDISKETIDLYFGIDYLGKRFNNCIAINRLAKYLGMSITVKTVYPTSSTVAFQVVK